VAAVSSYLPTGNAYVDGMLSGVKWASTSLTFSFPSSASFYEYSGERDNNFSAFTTQQQQAVRDVFKMYSSVAALTFAEITESSTTHATLRFAESDSPSTAWAYYPSTSAKGGDAWFNNSKNWYDNPVKGNYAYLTMMHEIGHALGLKHPHEARGSFGALPADMDSLEYTVMSYKSYLGSTSSGYTNASTSYPQTLMMLDIAALQTMYGVNYSTNAGDTVYKWSPTTGEMFINGVAQGAPAGNKIFMTIWDGGGNDTYDFSNYTTNIAVNLNPGEWTTVSSAQLASLGGGRLAAGNIANALLHQGNLFSLIENAIGGSGHDILIGNIGDNNLTGGGGNDWIDGGGGANTAWYSGLFSDYVWVQNTEGNWTVTDLRGGSPDGIDTLVNIHFLGFSDMTVALGDVVPPQPKPPAEPPSEPLAPNEAPVAVGDSYATTKNARLSIDAVKGVLANDSDANGDALSAVLVSGPQNGTLTLNADGSLNYTPTKNFIGTDSFTYKASDGQLSSSVTTVLINVTAAGGGKKGNGADPESNHAVEGTPAMIHAPSGVLFTLPDHEVDEDQIPEPLVFDLVDPVGIPSHSIEFLLV
jgi:serralysin